MRTAALQASGMHRISPVTAIAWLRALYFWTFTVLAAAFLVLTLAGGSLAQTSERDTDYYQNWLKTALRAEQVIDASRASSAAFEQLRKDLTGYRQSFQRVSGENKQRISTLESQLAALGDPPAEGSDEPEDIAALRASLTLQLNQLKVPRIVAEEAFRRANGLIGEIDIIIRDRRTKRLLERGPSPLNPEHWPGAFGALSKSGRTLWHETQAQIGNDTTVERISDDLPGILVLLITGILLVLRGRPWARAMGNYLRAFGARGTGVWSFVVSLLQVLLPLLGVLVLTTAVDLAGILGVRGTLMLENLPSWAFILLTFHWLGEQLVASRREVDLVSVGEGRRGEVRLMIDMLAAVLVLQDVLTQFNLLENTSQETSAVLAFPLIVAAALILLRLQKYGSLNSKPDAEADPDGEGRIAAGASRIIALVRQGSYLLGFVAPVLAALGYVNAAEALIYPAINTLFLLTALAVVQRFAGDLYGWLSGQGQAAQDSLLFVGIGFLLALLALPLLALIWGARVADLTELWSTFLAGFQIGDTRISPMAFLSFVVVFAAGYGLTRLIQSSLRNSLLPKTKIDPGGQNAIVSGLGYVGIFLAALVAISMAGLDLSSLAIVAGALSVGIGFGLQTIVSNFVSGIILLVERPISKGDWIEVGGLMGYVRDISVRSTRIETFDRSDVIVPNSDLITGTVTNYTRGNTVGRVIVPVGVAYGTDPRQVEAILSEIARAHPMVLMKPAPNVVFQGFGADSLDFEIRAILRDVNWVLSVKSDLNYEIVARFAAEGIEIPYAQRDLWIRNPEALGALAATAVAEAGTTAENGNMPKPAQPDLEDLGQADTDGDADGDK
ncbi:putative MscS family protein.1 precursor [Phaeobacter sp. CECT 5382]|nr:putative MscS family protein.1 precursor [Phaeobacter sp. CECT 5382]